MAKLASEREWHLLLRYPRGSVWRLHQRTGRPGVFMSPDGETDPQAELDATLKQFFLR